MYFDSFGITSILKFCLKLYILSSNQKLKVALAQKYQFYGHQKVVEIDPSVEKTLIDAISFLIKKCYFTAGHFVLKQKIGISTGIFLLLCIHRPSSILDNSLSIFLWQLISKGSPHAYKFPVTSKFIDNLCMVEIP